MDPSAWEWRASSRAPHPCSKDDSHPEVNIRTSSVLLHGGFGWKCGSLNVSQILFWHENFISCWLCDLSMSRLQTSLHVCPPSSLTFDPDGLCPHPQLFWFFDLPVLCSIWSLIFDIWFVPYVFLPVSNSLPCVLRSYDILDLRILEFSFFLTSGPTF